MSRYFLLLVVGIIFSTNVKSQGIFKYPNTVLGYQVLGSDAYYIGSTKDCLEGCYVYLDFAKPSESLYFVRISVQYVSSISYVVGNMYFFTANGKKITLTYKGRSHIYNLNRNGIQTAESFYYLTPSEWQLIMIEGICEIHFNILFNDRVNFPYALRPSNCLFKN